MHGDVHRSGESVGAVASAQPRTKDRETTVAAGLLDGLQPAVCPTDDQFHEFCRINRELRIERNAEGGVAVKGPAGWETAEKKRRDQIFR